jgi:transposase InsO family protein
VLEKDMPTLGDNATQEEKAAKEKFRKDELAVQGLMLGSMESELQRKYLDDTPKNMMAQLSKMFLDSARKQRYRTTLAFIGCKMAEGTSVNSHMLKMLGYLEKLEKLKAPIPADIAEDIILGSLPTSYKDFIMHLHMREKAPTLDEIHQSLKQAEVDMNKGKSERNILAVSQGSKKINNKGKGKKGKQTKGKWEGGAQASSSKGKFKNSPTPDTECYYCHKKGHFRANCTKYKKDLDSGIVERKRPKVPKGIFVIEINLTTSIHDWVIDTGSCAHICANMQALRDRRTLKKGEVVLKVGNGASVAAIAIGSLDLHLSSGLVMILNNVYYVPSICKNIISVSCLDIEGYDISISNSCCSLSKDGIFYANAFIRNGLYLLELNDKHVLNINNKKLKMSHENETLLWHYRLGHINEKRIKKLQEFNLLGLLDCKAIETCEPCLIGKMTKAPFKKKGTRAKDLLELIHSDVCGPMSISARDGYRYFITFIDDYSRYGYIYLMKNKSEAFGKFKEFKNEVENQLDKRIKALRTDRGGEYLSNEFSTYLKECGIIPQLTPPGTPQWNGVSERRNRTLLDMVRSMMCQTELPLYFWGYALHTAAYTLNLVPSKSVEKTPYELWLGKAPNLSFLKIWGCEAYVKRLMSTKLEPKADKCFFIGYPRETKGYYFWHKSTNRILVENGAIFLENEFLQRLKSSGSSVTLEETQETLQDHEDQDIPTMVPMASGSMNERVPQTIEEEVHISPPSVQPLQVELEHIPQEIEDDVQEVQEEPQEHQVPQEPRRSIRVRKKPDFYLGLHEISVMDTEDPLTFHEAMNRDDSQSWYEAMKSEMQSM